MQRVPMTMDLYQQALTNGYVIDIGQVDAKRRRELDKLAHTGAVTKAVGVFPDLIVGISPPKTVWVALRPGLL